MILNRNERLLTQAHPHRQDERMQGQMICPAQQLPEARGSQKKAYEAIHRLPLRGDHLDLFPQCMRDSPESPAKELSVERLCRSRSLKNSRSGIFCKLVVPTRKPTYSGDRCTNTPSVLHEDTCARGENYHRRQTEDYMGSFASRSSSAPAAHAATSLAAITTSS